MRHALRFVRMSIAVALLPACLAFGADQPPAQPAKKAPNPSLAPVEDEPGLPRVLLIGDSISIGYTLPTRELLKGKANVHRIPTNGGPTTNGVANLDKWLGDKPWDVIHFNFGLHDLKYMPDGKRQVSLEDYEANLRTIVARLKKTGAKVIWCTTTPVPEEVGGVKRVPGEVLEYNAAAARVTGSEGLLVDDLYAFALPQLSKIQLEKNVHFSGDGSKVLAEQVSRSILTALGK
ncbi:MAG: SGNH/GDSL hydrolase family protein [Planctomycetes bacterium]|nr:SGNH/GDSL hydrolase family protein [Planctomycetota bacterium]